MFSIVFDEIGSIRNFQKKLIPAGSLSLFYRVSFISPFYIFYRVLYSARDRVICSRGRVMTINYVGGNRYGCVRAYLGRRNKITCIVRRIDGHVSSIANIYITPL